MFFKPGHEPEGAIEKIKELTERLREAFPTGISISE
jgi:hypothetical protein